MVRVIGEENRLNGGKEESGWVYMEKGKRMHG